MVQIYTTLYTFGVDYSKLVRTFTENKVIKLNGYANYYGTTPFKISNVNSESVHVSKNKPLFEALQGDVPNLF